MNRAEMIENVYETLVACGITGCDERPTAEHVVTRLLAESGDDTAEFRVRRDAPSTSKAIVDKVSDGTFQAQMLYLFNVERHPDAFKVMDGWTDYELEARLGRSHQSVSATRNTLMRKGYVVDSGERRRNKYGNPAIVYVWTGKEQVQ